MDGFRPLNFGKLKRAFLIAFLIWLPVSAQGLVVKYWFLRSARFQSLAASLSQDSLTFGQQISFFRGNLLMTLIAAPLLLIVVRHLCPERWLWRLPIALSCLALILQTIAFGELAVFGHLASARLMGEAIGWGLNNPGLALHYMWRGMPAFGLAAIALVAAGMLRVFWRAPIFGRALHVVAATIWTLSAAVAAFAWLPWMKETPFHEPLLMMSITALFESHDPSGAYAGRTTRQLRSAYEEASNAPDPDAQRPYVGAAAGYDVILWVSETGPAFYLGADPSKSEFPNLKRLAGHSFVALRHYTTSPSSYRAMAAVLCSVYPPEFNRVGHGKVRNAPGLIRGLKGKGYWTGAYLSACFGTVFGEQEKSFYVGAGAHRVFTPSTQPLTQGKAEDSDALDQVDADGLAELTRDYRRVVASGKPFFGLYVPQLAHEPWSDLTPARHEPNPRLRRIEIMRREDRRLGQLIRTIEESGRLDRTLIAFTFDHGLRFAPSVVDTRFREGQVEDLTFHLPFLLYAPGVLREQVNLPWPTSHLDISPSILDLVGVSQDRGFELGAAVWRPDLSNRRLFFWGRQYFGADGYLRGNVYAMWDPLLSTTYRSNVLHFEPRDTLTENDPAHHQIIARIRDMYAFDNAWYEAVLKESGAE